MLAAVDRHLDAGLDQGGYTDWRLPTIHELEGIHAPDADKEDATAVGWPAVEARDDDQEITQEMPAAVSPEAETVPTEAVRPPSRSGPSGMVIAIVVAVVGALAAWFLL